MKRNLYKYDIPDSFKAKEISIDTETTGLNLNRDRLCLIQLMNEEEEVVLVQFPNPSYKEAKNLRALLSSNIRKYFHFARFDMAMIYKTFNVMVKNAVCTKILSKVVRTYTDRHSLKELCRELIGISLDKGEGCSYWAKEDLSSSQIEYATSDVLYLPSLYKQLLKLAERENKYHIAEKSFSLLPSICLFDLQEVDALDFICH
jgi:ribonuclease D